MTATTSACQNDGDDRETLLDGVDGGEYLITETPTLEGLIFAEFDLDQGPVARIQVPERMFSDDEFKAHLKSFIIPHKELQNRMVKFIYKQYKIIGHPVGLECTQYLRGERTFNMCFVVHRDSTADCMYEPMVQKLAEYLTEMEQEFSFIERHKNELPGIMQRILEGMNSKGECDILVTNMTRMFLRLCPAYRGVEPPKISLYMVPMLIRKVQKEEWPRLVEKMDVLSQRIIPEIDGVRCVQEIAKMVSIDADLVMRCIRNLVFYEVVSLLPLFLYSNTYVATEKLHGFYNTKKMVEECVEFVRLTNAKGERGPPPKFTDAFRLYLSLRCGVTLREWVLAEQPRRYHVDERRLIQFGMHHRFLRKLSVYPVSIDKLSCGRLARACDGTNALEDLAVMYGIFPEELLEMLVESGKFEFLSR